MRRKDCSRVHRGHREQTPGVKLVVQGSDIFSWISIWDVPSVSLIFYGVSKSEQGTDETFVCRFGGVGNRRKRTLLKT